MSKKIIYGLLISVLLASLMMALVVSVQAQGIPSTPTPSGFPAVSSTPTLSVVQPLSSNPVDANVVTFTQLQQGEIQLIGPYDSASFTFAIPADWKLSLGAQLNLFLGISFNTVSAYVQGQPISPIIGGGTLTISLNNTTLGVISLDQVGDFKNNIDIPLEAFTSTRSDGRMVLRFTLDSGLYCLANDHMQVVIRPTSQFQLPHTSTLPSTNLTNFPRPIYQNSFVKDSALLIIPDQPSPAELQAALTVAAGLGSLSGDSMLLDMIPMSKFNPSLAGSTQSANHFILVGNATSLPVLAQFALPLPEVGNSFQNQGGNQDDGVVEMINSPWSAAHVILVVSGNTNNGTLKAAQAVSTGVLRPNRFPNLSIVQKVQPTPVSTPQPVDQTLSDMGYKGTLFDSRGVDSVSYTINVPPGMTAGADSYFQLAFGNSALLDYNRSEIIVMLNNRPIGSVRMNDTTASQSINQVKITIPPSEILPGKNRIDVIVNIVPLDDCTPPNLQGLWINIWPESMLHLPLTQATVNPLTVQALNSYPAPFIYNPLLSDTAFVLQKNDLAGWTSAVHIASYLGDRANGPVTELSAFYGDNIPQTERAKYNLIIIGQPSQLPLIKDINESLPAPFSTGSDLATENNFQVTYRIPPDSPMGYVEIMTSPWNPANVVLGILGNTSEGVGWASTSLIDPTLRSRLAGNFASIYNRQIITTDTRLASNLTGNSSAQVPNVPNQPTVTPPTYASVARPGWILPVLVISIILIIIILIVVIFGNWLGNRTRGPHKTG
jgi:hypothetical protein